MVLSDPGQPASGKPRGGRLPIVVLLVWAIVVFAIPRAVQPLGVVDVLAVPLGFFMMAQGCLIALLAIALLAARRQDRLEAIDNERQ